MLNLSILESAGVALAYHRILVNKLQERARQRSAQVSDFTELLKKEDFTIKGQAKREIQTAVEKGKKELQTTRDARTRTPFPPKAPAQRPQPAVLRQRSRSRTPARSPVRDRQKTTSGRKTSS